MQARTGPSAGQKASILQAVGFVMGCSANYAVHASWVGSGSADKLSAPTGPGTNGGSEALKCSLVPSVVACLPGGLALG